MRGLTAAERQALLLRDDESCDQFDAEVMQLLVDGRAILVPEEDDEFTWHGFYTTDLGRLALRVCPVDE